jgi:hypothetical protein
MKTKLFATVNLPWVPEPGSDIIRMEFEDGSTTKGQPERLCKDCPGFDTYGDVLDCKTCPKLPKEKQDL